MVQCTLMGGLVAIFSNRSSAIRGVLNWCCTQDYFLLDAAPLLRLNGGRRPDLIAEVLVLSTEAETRGQRK